MQGDRLSPVPGAGSSRSPAPASSDDWRSAASKLLDDFIAFVSNNEMVKKNSKAPHRIFVNEQSWTPEGSWFHYHCLTLYGLTNISPV